MKLNYFQCHYYCTSRAIKKYSITNNILSKKRRILPYIFEKRQSTSFVFFNKKIEWSIWTYIVSLSDVISLYIKFLDRQIYIHNIYDSINVKKMNTNILVLEQKLVASLYIQHIAFGNFNLHYKSQKRLKVSTAYIKIQKSYCWLSKDKR